VTGINYMSAGNTFSDSDTVLNTDFERFANEGIKHISMRLIWSTLEPTYNSLTCKLSSTVLANHKRVLAMAQRYGIGVNVDFWTHFQDVHWDMPSYIRSIFDIVRNSNSKQLWLRFVTTMVAELKSYQSVESWAILNEPFYSYSSDKPLFQQLFAEQVAAIKSVDNTRPVVCRFTLSYTPASGRFDTSVYSLFDAFAVTEYLDPSNPRDTEYNAKWSYWDKTVSDCQARNIPLWVIEFGDDSTNTEHVRLHYELSLQKFQAAGVVKAYAWAWQTRSATSERFNIYGGTKPKPAYYELSKYADGNYIPPPDNPEPPAEEPSPAYVFEDGFESGSFNNWSGRKLTSGETVKASSNTPYDGQYRASFTTNGNYHGSEDAYIYKNIDMSEVYARGYIRVSGSRILADSGDTVYFLRLSDSAQSLAQVGIRRQSGVNQWVLYARSGSSWIGPIVSKTPAISTNQWYCIELHWNPAQGIAELYVNGVNILQQTNLGTSSVGNAKTVDFGIISATNVQNGLAVYGDCFKISNIYNGPETN
jgi:hypothetical protein